MTIWNKPPRPWAKRHPKKLTRLSIGEASLVRLGANVGAKILIAKHDEDKAMQETEVRKIDVDHDLRRYLELVEPDADYGTALSKRWTDPTVQGFYQEYAEAGPDLMPEPVAKAVEPGGESWARIEKAAKELMLGAPVTFPAAVEEICRRHPNWYREYVEEQRGVD